jgi:hypothetical protein
MAKKSVSQNDEPELDESKIEESVDSETELDESIDAVEDRSASLKELESPQATATTPMPMGNKARAMRDQLAKEPKVRVFIPLANGEKQGVTQSVILNGYPMYIRKGGYVEVPQSVAEVLETKLKHKMSVEDHPERISADRPVKMTSYGN